MTSFLELLKKLQCKIVGHEAITLDWERTQEKVYFETICNRCCHFTTSEIFYDIHNMRLKDNDV